MSFGPTGGLVEKMFFSQPDPEKIKEHPLFAEFKRRGYLPYKKALRLAMDCHVSNPYNPDKPIASDLHASVVEALHKKGVLNSLVDFDKVGYYSSLYTPLDYFHGVDGILIVETGEGKIVVSLDVTINPHKSHAKADFVIQAGDMPDAKLEKEKYKKFIHKLAEEIADVIVYKLKDLRRKKVIPKFLPDNIASLPEKRVNH